MITFNHQDRWGQYHFILKLHDISFYLYRSNLTIAEPDFAPLLLNKIKDKIDTYATSKGASFVVLSLLECETTQKEVKDLLMPHLAALKQSSESGSKVLVKHLTGSATIKKQKLQDLGDAAYIPGQDKMEVEHDEPKPQTKQAKTEAKPAAKPVQAKAAQAKPAQGKADAKPAAKPVQAKPAQAQTKQQNGASAKPAKAAANGNGATVAKKTNDAAPVKKAVPAKKVAPAAETKVAAKAKPVNNTAAKKKVAKK